ncbi:mitochondrial small ribosomal subunit protein uS17m [Candidatus Peregrinibacteria bacterium]|nr:mitochondrial small ribosomal subunit protein uS17m [Candidatus Peregrinibacteria bacterium]
MRTKKGVITSTKMTGTVAVTVHSLAFHPVYKKSFRRSKKFLCDSNGLDLYLGDEVVFQECRPLSKRKCFKVTEILKAAPRVSEVKEDEAVEKVIHREKNKTVNAKQAASSSSAS